MQTKRQREATEQLHEQGKARAAQLQRDAEAFVQRVAAAADKTTNPLHQLDLDALRERVVNHRLGTNANGWKNPFPRAIRRTSFQYGFEYWHDAARFKGHECQPPERKDFNSEGGAAEDYHMHPKHMWMIAAPSERQSLDSQDQQKAVGGGLWPGHRG